MIHEPLVDGGVHDALHLGVDQLDLGLRLEARVWKLDTQDSGESFAHVVTGEGGVLLLEDIVGLGVLVDRTSEGGPHAGQVGASIGIRDGIRETENLIGVGVVILQDGVDKDLVALARNDDRLWVKDCAGLSKLAYELLDAVLVEEGFVAGTVLLVVALVGEDDLDAGVQEGKLAEAAGQALELEGRGDREDLGIGKEGDEGAGLLLVLQFAEDRQWLGGLTLGEGHEVDLPLAHDLDLEPGGEGVDALRADAVETSRVLVGSLAELAAGVEIGHDEFEGRDLELGMDLHRNTAAIITNGDGSVGVNGDFDTCAVSGQMLVDRVIENLEDAVVESALIGISDVHARALTDGLESLQFVDLGSAVFFTTGRVLLLGNIGVVERDDGFCRFFFSHGRVSECPGKGRIYSSQKGREARGGGQRFFGYLMAKSAGYGYCSSNPTLHLGGGKLMNLELSRNGCEATAGPANSGNNIPFV